MAAHKIARPAAYRPDAWWSTYTLPVSESLPALYEQIRVSVCSLHSPALFLSTQLPRTGLSSFGFYGSDRHGAETLQFTNWAGCSLDSAFGFSSSGLGFLSGTVGQRVVEAKSVQLGHSCLCLLQRLFFG
jgi:hypothetical protein